MSEAVAERAPLPAGTAENLKPEALKALLAEGGTWDDDRVYNEALKV